MVLHAICGLRSKASGSKFTSTTTRILAITLDIVFRVKMTSGCSHIHDLIHVNMAQTSLPSYTYLAIYLAQYNASYIWVLLLSCKSEKTLSILTENYIYSTVLSFLNGYNSVYVSLIISNTNIMW